MPPVQGSDLGVCNQLQALRQDLPMSGLFYRPAVEGHPVYRLPQGIQVPRVQGQGIRQHIRYLHEVREGDLTCKVDPFSPDGLPSIFEKLIYFQYIFSHPLYNNIINYLIRNPF